MRVVSENVYARGKHGNLYVRRRIPAAVRAAYPSHQEHVVRSLGTADLRAAKELARAENTRIDIEFRQKRQELELSRASLAAKRISKLDDEQLQTVAKFWVRQVLQSDDSRRQAGLDDAEFDELGEQLATQRAELRRMLALGKSLNIFPALHGFLFLCDLDFNPDEDEAKRASYAFLRTAVETLDHQLTRQRGDIVDTDPVPDSVPFRSRNFRLLTLYPIQYRSEVGTSGSSGIAIAGSSRQLRANSAGVDQSSAEWGRLSL